jgi:hypothetical protein
MHDHDEIPVRVTATVPTHLATQPSTRALRVPVVRPSLLSSHLKEGVREEDWLDTEASTGRGYLCRHV